MTWLAFVVAALAVYRLSKMIAEDRGPFDLLLKLRNHFTGEDWISDGIRCHKCLSFWFGWIAAIPLPWTWWPEYVLLALALSGATLMLEKYWKR